MDKFFLIKKRIRKIRESKGLSRPKVSKETGIPRGTIEEWETNGTLPRLDRAEILANYYNVSLDYITCRTDNSEINKETPKDNSKINK